MLLCFNSFCNSIQPTSCIVFSLTRLSVIRIALPGQTGKLGANVPVHVNVVYGEELGRAWENWEDVRVNLLKKKAAIPK